MKKLVFGLIVLITMVGCTSQPKEKIVPTVVGEWKLVDEQPLSMPPKGYDAEAYLGTCLTLADDGSFVNSDSLSGTWYPHGQTLNFVFVDEDTKYVAEVYEIMSLTENKLRLRAYISDDEDGYFLLLTFDRVGEA